MPDAEDTAEASDPDGLEDVAAPDPAQAIAALQSLFATLVPPKSLELEDALGNRYQARPVLPARAQIKVLQQLQKLFDQPSGQIMMGDRSVAGVVGTIVAMAADEKILAGICDAFAAAHPKVLAKATANAGAGATDDPAELFPLEELVAGLIPFFIRFATRAASLIQMSPTAAEA